MGKKKDGEEERGLSKTEGRGRQAAGRGESRRANREGMVELIGGTRGRIKKSKKRTCGQ